MYSGRRHELLDVRSRHTALAWAISRFSARVAIVHGSNVQLAVRIDRETSIAPQTNAVSSPTFTGWKRCLAKAPSCSTACRSDSRPAAVVGVTPGLVDSAWVEEHAVEFAEICSLLRECAGFALGPRAIPTRTARPLPVNCCNCFCNSAFTRNGQPEEDARFGDHQMVRGSLPSIRLSNKKRMPSKSNPGTPILHQTAWLYASAGPSR